MLKRILENEKNFFTFLYFEVALGAEYLQTLGAFGKLEN